MNKILLHRCHWDESQCKEIVRASGTWLEGNAKGMINILSAGFGPGENKQAYKHPRYTRNYEDLGILILKISLHDHLVGTYQHTDMIYYFCSKVLWK